MIVPQGCVGVAYLMNKTCLYVFYMCVRYVVPGAAVVRGNNVGWDRDGWDLGLPCNCQDLGFTYNIPTGGGT